MIKHPGGDKFRIQQLPETPPFQTLPETPPFRPPVGRPPFRPPQPSPPLRPPLPEFLPPFEGPGFPGIGQQRFRRCLNRVSEITLLGGRRIWFYPTAIRNQNLIGYRWSQFNWERASIPLFRIRSIDCF